jgi:hypothetical protein
MSKTIDTLVEDIYEVIRTGGGWNETISELLGKDLSGVFDRRLVHEDREPTLRMSNLGSPCQRKLWYSLHKSSQGEPLPPQAKFKYLYGDILESVLIHLAIAAGHRVEGIQSPLEISGIKGHRDCVIDGITVDVKSASSFAYKKFESGGLRGDDPFGYISQLSSYVYAGRSDPIQSDPNVGAFLVVDKQHGHICLDKYDFSFELLGKEEEVEKIKAIASSDICPDRAFEDIPEGASGNRKLGVNCSYCDHKASCWPNLRTFIYSRGPVFLTTVKKEPNVPEKVWSEDTRDEDIIEVSQ